MLKGGALVLQRSEYQELLARLREGVSSLESLINMNAELEPDRRRRSQGRLNKLLRDLAGGFYSALKSAVVTCQCPGLHDVGLKLANQPMTITPHDSDADVMRMLKLGLAVSYAPTALETSGHLWGSIRMWNRVHVQLTQDPQPLAPATPVVPMTSKRKRVGFAVSTNTPAMISTQAPLQLQQLKPGKIANLCQAVRNAQKLRAGECCGHITDDSRTPCPKYEVYPSGDVDVGCDWCLVSLKDVLAAGEAGPSPPLLYGDKLQLAWVITSSVLQLQGTPWLPGALTHDEIFLAKKDGILLYREVFVLKRLPEPGAAAQQVAAANLMTFALGILLIELILGRTIEKLQPGTASITAACNLWAQISSYEAARQLLDKVNTFGGPNYHSAVSRCIKGNLYDDEPNGADVFFSGVLGLLEQDLEMAVG